MMNKGYNKSLSNRAVLCSVKKERGYDFHDSLTFPSNPHANNHRQQFPDVDDFLARKLLDISILA